MNVLLEKLIIFTPMVDIINSLYLLIIMDLIENLPEDLIGVLMGALWEISEVSVLILSFVNKFCYRIARKCFMQYHPYTKLKNWYNKGSHIQVVADGSLEILKWFHSIGKSWDYDVCFWATLFGQLDILKWAKVNGAWGVNRICYHAVIYGHIEVFRWAISQCCYLDDETEQLARKKWPNLFPINYLLLEYPMKN